MPKEDRYHPIVVHGLKKAGWTVLKEQETISIGSHNDSNRLQEEIIQWIPEP